MRHFKSPRASRSGPVHITRADGTTETCKAYTPAQMHELAKAEARAQQKPGPRKQNLREASRKVLRKGGAR